MAGATLQWVQQLSMAVASNISDLMAPLEALFLVERTGVGEDGIKVPTSSTELDLEDITPGTVGGTDADYSFDGVDIKPLPRSVQIPITEHQLENAQPSQIMDIIDRMTEATHKKIVGLLGTAIAARMTDPSNYIGAGPTQVVDAALMRAAKWKLRKNHAAGPLSCILTAGAMDELEGDLESKNLTARLTDLLVDGAEIFRYSGTTVYPDVYLGNDGGDPATEYNYMGVKKSVRIVYGGVGPRIKILPTEDPVHVRLGMAVWVSVGIPNPDLGMWIKGEA